MRRAGSPAMQGRVQRGRRRSAGDAAVLDGGGRRGQRRGRRRRLRASRLDGLGGEEEEVAAELGAASAGHGELQRRRIDGD